MSGGAPHKSSVSHSRSENAASALRGHRKRKRVKDKWDRLGTVAVMGDGRERESLRRCRTTDEVGIGASAGSGVFRNSCCPAPQRRRSGRIGLKWLISGGSEGAPGRRVFPNCIHTSAANIPRPISILMNASASPRLASLLVTRRRAFVRRASGSARACFRLVEPFAAPTSAPRKGEVAAFN